LPRALRLMASPLTTEVHFVQAGDSPILQGSGTDVLSCACGNHLIEGYRTAQFLAIGIQCGRCGAVTATQSLPANELPPSGVIVAEPSQEPRSGSMTVPDGVAVIGRAERDRLAVLLRPATPDSWIYRISAALLDDAEAAFVRHTGEPLPQPDTGPTERFAGLRDHALGWSVRHLRGRLASGAWSCAEDAPTANAVTHVAGFLHFVATWSHHPLFPAMAATAGGKGFSLHGLAPFAAAHALAMMGNRISFPAPAGHPGRVEGFAIGAGGGENVAVHVEVFDRFEFPFGQKWEQASLRTAVSELLAAAQGRINLRHPGVLLLSPGTVLGGFDQALIEAIKSSLQSLGRKNRGLLAAGPIVLRLQTQPDPHVVRFGYGLFPIENRHFMGDTQIQGLR
jgi:hypothetical protein